jgi:hypothetical protein
MMVSMVRRSSLRGRAPRSFTAANRRFELDPLGIAQRLHGFTPDKAAENPDFPRFAKSSIGD